LGFKRIGVVTLTVQAYVTSSITRVTIQFAIGHLLLVVIVACLQPFSR